MNSHLNTDPYKGTRDFFPPDMALQREIFKTWERVAESYGYERYDASVLEPAELYRSKTSEEIVNEQTYTFLDRGNREVTLRPEMTPTVARMIAAKQRDLIFPVRWYAIPNLFRYERPQRGRLREHWQLNCDLFGERDISADIEIIKLAHDVLVGFGATEDMFTVRVNDRALMAHWYSKVLGLNETAIKAVSRLVDRKEKVTAEAFKKSLGEHLDHRQITMLTEALLTVDPKTLHAETVVTDIMQGLETLGVRNVVFDASLARGFDYYTGTVFEIFDNSSENRRSLIGGGRYDNLTKLFGGEAITGVGFGMGDVTVRDFLEVHGLMPHPEYAPTLAILPMHTGLNLHAAKLADEFRAAHICTAVDMSNRKIGKKISSAHTARIPFALVLGDDEVASHRYTLKELATEKETKGAIAELINLLP